MLDESIERDSQEPISLKFSLSKNQFVDVLKIKNFWLLGITNSLVALQAMILQSVGPLYLKEYGYSETYAAVMISIIIAVGLLAAALMNISNKVYLMNKICLF